MDATDIRERINSLISTRAADDRLFRLLRNTRLAGSFGHVGRLHWRILMLLAVLGILFVPLREGFLQVRDEAIARNAVADVVRRLAPADAVVTRQVDVAPDRVSVRLVVTARLDATKTREAERELIRRTGKEVTLSVRKVAGEEELALLRERLRAPAPQAVPDLGTLRSELVSRLDAPLKEAWPASNATLTDFELGFTPTETVVHVRYSAPEPLNPAVGEVIENLLRARMDFSQLRVLLEQANPPPPVPPAPQKRTMQRRR